MIRILTSIALAAGVWLAMPAPAQAAQSYDNCTGFISSLPATISTQGTWCLNKDVTTNMASGAAIAIATNNVTIDCNHFKVGGLGAGAGTTTYGVVASARLNATVRNCSVRGFYVGLYFVGGGGHRVENNGFDGNTLYGVLVESAASTIRGNMIIDTGGSAHAGSAFGILATSGVDVLDNTVNGVAPTGTDSNAHGIYTYLNGNGSVTGNRVRELAPAGSGAPYGIVAFYSDGSVISDNVVQGPGTGVAGSIGIYCLANTVTAVRNVVSRFANGIATCHSSGNVVNTN